MRSILSLTSVIALSVLVVPSVALGFDLSALYTNGAVSAKGGFDVTTAKQTTEVSGYYIDPSGADSRWGFNSTTKSGLYDPFGLYTTVGWYNSHKDAGVGLTLGSETRYITKSYKREWPSGSDDTPSHLGSLSLTTVTEVRTVRFRSVNEWIYGSGDNSRIDQQYDVGIRLNTYVYIDAGWSTRKGIETRFVGIGLHW